ncbi:MAG: TonB-dependent receptor [Mucilaginibacter polytrichastri]|nr:TonB-dependent receptor [Mucilaginibacter polytrichastri]
MQIHAKTFAQKVSINANNADLKEILTQINKQTGYSFLYKNSVIKEIGQLSLNIRNLDLKDALDLCFRGHKVKYNIRNKTILIQQVQNASADQELNSLKIISLLDPVKGVVRDSATNETLVGVSVQIEGKNAGVVTDNNGQFLLTEADQGETLIITYIGYSTQRVSLGTDRFLNIRLSKTDTKLNEVVVVGYGAREKGSLTGAISTVKSDVFENRPLNNSFDALQGTVPGLTITKGSGQPGNQSYGLQIRGYSSINGNQPLVLIDNVPGDINTINTNDIASVTVLKDAAASIYGARAADGVILVTTKKGKQGSPVVTYAGNFGLKTPAYLRQIQNTLQFAEFMDEGLRNAGLDGFSSEVFDKIRSNAAPDLENGWNYGVTNFPGFYGYTNWNDAVYKDASQQIHNVSISGGGESSNYLVSLGYKRDNGILRYGDNSSDGYNLRLNYDFRLSQKFSVETRTNFDNTATKTPTLLGSALTNVTRQFPYQPVFNPLGQFYGYQGYENPAQYLAEGGVQSTNFSRFATNLKFDYFVLPELKITGQGAFRLDYLNDNGYLPTITRFNYAGGVQDIRNTPNSAFYSNNKVLNKLYQVYADYNKRFDKHQVNLTAGASLEQTRVEGQTTNGYNFIGNQIFTLNLADRTRAAYANFTGLLNNQALGSYFGRLSYSFNDRLFVDVTARADGSSKFAPEKRWSAVFPSASIAYNVAKEKFLSEAKFVDLLKFRVSWGKMGNQEIGALGLYDYIPLITVGGQYPIGAPNAGLTGANANPASIGRTWETIENRNVGVDLALLKSRLTFSFDYFNKINNDMLVNIAVPATFGATPPSSNQGKLDTKGFEAIIGWNDKIRDFRYSISVQLSDSRNKLVELKNSDNFNQGLNFTRQGFPIYSYFGYVYEGIIKDQAQLDAYKQLEGVPSRIAIGDVMFKDVDGDGKITAFGDRTKGLPGDMVYLGNLIPRYTFSSNITLGYKQFDLQVFMQGVGKRNVIYEGALSTPNTFFWPSLSYYSGRTWSPERPDAQFPRYLPGSVGYDDIRSFNYRPSALTLQNVAYLRFKVITLGYNLPQTIASKILMKSARLYVSGQDMFTFSKGTLGGNFDPEDGFRNEGTYPFNKVYSVGLNANF